MMRVENAVVKRTSIGREDHGIMTAFVHLEGDCWGVGFGGFELDDCGPNGRVDSELLGWFVRRVLETLEAESWEKVTGQSVRCRSDGPGGGCLAIGHLIKDKWFEPRKELQAK